MDALRSWAYSVGAVVIFGTIAESLAPGESYRKYIHIILGALLIITLVRPLSGLFKNGVPDSIIPHIDSPPISSGLIEEKQRKDVEEIYRQRLEEMIKTEITAKTDAAVKCVSVELAEYNSSWAIQSVTIIAENSTSRIKTLTAELTGLNPDSIYVTEYTKEVDGNE